MLLSRGGSLTTSISRDSLSESSLHTLRDVVAVSYFDGDIDSQDPYRSSDHHHHETSIDCFHS